MIPWHMDDQGDTDRVYLIVASIIGSFLGTMGAVIVLITSVSSPVKAMSKRIIIMISIADVLVAFPTLVVSVFHFEWHLTSSKEAESDLQKWMESAACKWQSLFITTGAMLTFLWTFGLSQHMFLLVRFGIKVAHKAYICLYFLSIVPFAVNILAFNYNVLGADDSYNISSQHEHHMASWCWIRVNNTTRHHGPWLARSCPAAIWDGKGFEIFCYIGVTLYCVLARYHMDRISGYELLDSSDEYDVRRSHGDVTDGHNYTGAALRVNKILAIPLFLILIRMWSTTLRLSCYCLDHSAICTSTFLVFMENFCDPLQGFGNCILYKLSLGETCNCKCPESLGRLKLGLRGRIPPRSNEPVTVWVPQDSADFSEY